jgi:hypothetical protein
MSLREIGNFAASELYPALIGRTISFAGPNGVRVTDELTSIISFQDNEEVAVRTKNAIPAGSEFEFRDRMWGNYWKLGWGVVVEIGALVRNGDRKGAEPSDAGGA